MSSLTQNNGMNKLLLVVALLLFCIGVAVVYTASAPYAMSKGMDAERYMMSHLPKAVGGIALMLGIARFVDYGHWKWLGRVVFIVFAILTLVALLKGTGVKGANRWIFGIQPSEFMKLGLIIWVCAKFSMAGDYIKTFKCSIVEPAIPLLVAFILLWRQPNLSMMGMISVLVGCIMLVAGVNYKYLGMAVLVGVLAIGVVVINSPHAMKRFMAHSADDTEMVESQRQGKNALEALGNGGLTGTGYGQSTHKFVGYLPEAHKDVVYSVIGEEFGFVGTSSLLLLYALLFAQGFKISQHSSTRFGKYLAFGLTMSLFSNFLVHVCVCVGLIPVTGQPLPFISYGGTNLIYSSVVMGILLNISRPSSGRKIKEPFASQAALESSVFRNFEFTRSGV